MTRADVINAVDAERDRQEKLLADGTIPALCSQPDCADVLRLAALMEEVGEVGRAILDRENDGLIEELIQVAAVAVAWVEGVTA